LSNYVKLFFLLNLEIFHNHLKIRDKKT